MTRAKRTPAAIAAMLATSVLFIGVMSSPAAAADICEGATCNGKDPAATHCNDDAVTVDDVTTAAGIRLRLRYSSNCRAIWGRVDNARAGDRVRVQRHPNDVNPDLNYVATVPSGERSVYTPMLNDKNVRGNACVRDVSNGALTCTGYF
ncbi:hypothetical protein Val02_16680 [Virgisporangium aliadipatigenens]|uniref:DUF2690 domain-containing protein n=1 Tax=Virgisporangium aliadipatigenens TaxID=741659 RepID=A0A8J3YI79_9ACTN|nr:DUF2690 domain-containing protein [Virgisporangium aliadipatigenens]GIJ44782.1 hypothetical protein Val02_16680 [Virgisporangium aliadipatigenens]